MKVIIECTSYTNGTKVTIETPSDDVPAEDALDMAKRALVAWGYQPENIFDPPQDTCDCDDCTKNKPSGNRTKKSKKGVA